MANRNTQGFGLIAAGTLGSTPATSGQGKYKIDAGYATTIYNGGAVSSSAGYVIDGQTTDAAILGVLNGIFYNAATTLKPTFANFYTQVTPANSEDIDAFVFDNPQQQYVVAIDNTLAQAGYLETYDMNASAGDDTTGKSTSTLDHDDTSADAASFRLLRSAEDPENDENAAFRSVVVVPNLINLQKGQ
jgi:hypothetical protein|tara:strand:- start:6 stop:572 length:567 start_codon:yes stop_codon:yes gene_type:complete